jgi:hypothetical protein
MQDVLIILINELYNWYFNKMIILKYKIHFQKINFNFI